MGLCTHSSFILNTLCLTLTWHKSSPIVSAKITDFLDPEDDDSSLIMEPYELDRLSQDPSWRRMPVVGGTELRRFRHGFGLHLATTSCCCCCCGWQDNFLTTPRCCCWETNILACFFAPGWKYEVFFVFYNVAIVSRVSYSLRLLACSPLYYWALCCCFFSFRLCCCRSDVVAGEPLARTRTHARTHAAASSIRKRSKSESLQFVGRSGSV